MRFPIRPSNVRVYGFRHFGSLSIPAKIKRRQNLVVFEKQFKMPEQIGGMPVPSPKN
jgi:hypothetical protein